MSLSELMIDIPAEHERNVFGQFDAYAKKLERTFHVTLIAREGKVKILGEDKNAEKARRVLDQLAALSKRGNEITEQNVDYAMSLVYEDQEEAMVEMDRELICHTLQGKPIKPKTLGQKRYVDAIREGMITFGLGPAGTGKTYLAMQLCQIISFIFFCFPFHGNTSLLFILLPRHLPVHHILVTHLISDSEQTDKHKQDHKKANTVFLLHKSPTPFFIQYWLFVPVLFSSLDFVNPDIQCHHHRPGLSPVEKS